MANIFEKWNNAVDTKKLAEEVKEQAKNNGNTHEDVPFGNYEVKIDKMELKESSKGDPMVSVWFKIIKGEHKDRLIFMNQVILKPFQIHIMNEFLRSLDSGIDVDFLDYAQYNDLILDIHEAIDGSAEYLLEYSETEKGYSRFEILEVYDA